MKASLFMLSYSFSQTLVWLLVAYLGGSVSVFTMFLFRNLVGFVLSGFNGPGWGFSAHTLRRWPMHLLRSAATLLGGLSIFFSVTRIPVADSVAITFLAPIFGALLSVWFFKERFTRRMLVKLFCGLMGVGMITGFSAEGDLVGYLAAVCGAFMTAVAYVSVKSLSETERTSDILSVSYLLMVPVATCLAMPDWVTPSLSELFWLLSIGTAFYVSQICLANAFSLDSAARLMPLDFTRIVFASALGGLVLGQSIDGNTLLGSLVILTVSLIPEKPRDPLPH